MNETSSKNEITSGIIWKQLLLFFFPILLGSFFQQLYNIFIQHNYSSLYLELCGSFVALIIAQIQRKRKILVVLLVTLIFHSFLNNKAHTRTAPSHPYMGFVMNF